MQYRKKPVVIDAEQWQGNKASIIQFFSIYGFRDYHFKMSEDKLHEDLVIKTLEGDMLASFGDFIIRGVSGEFYPCKPDIFHQTYEAVL